MHVFQPFSLSKLELDPYTITGQSGVCITVEYEGKVNTTSSGQIMFGKMWGKDVIMVFIREQRYTMELLDKADFFSVTFFDDSFKSSLAYLKSVSGRVENKIEQIGMHVNRRIDIPYIDEGNLVFLCDKLASLSMSCDKDSEFISDRVSKSFYSDGNPHHIFVGEILEVMAR